MVDDGDGDVDNVDSVDDDDESAAVVTINNH